MIRAAFRFLGLFALAGAFAVAAADAAHSVMEGRLALTGAGRLAASLAPGAQAPRWLAAALQALGMLPAALVLALAAAAAFRLGRAPRARIGDAGR